MISSYPPIIDSLLFQLPTLSILGLCHVSRHLRDFLQHYVTAWNYLSFRKIRMVLTEGERTAQSKSDAADQLLCAIVVPFGLRLQSLELDNTAVSGAALILMVLPFRRETLRHISFRHCIQVSLKHHIIPYLRIYNSQKCVSTAVPFAPMALKSLYAYKCQHNMDQSNYRHYRRESIFAHYTYELVKLCHQLEIWTDTTFCSTPAQRCMGSRVNLSAPRIQVENEGWMTYDRLWRSDNWLGPLTTQGEANSTNNPGRLWEESEPGHEGEPLGSECWPIQGEAKGLPTHLRQSHRRFVDNIECSQCGTPIPERCHICSITMHCTGCRKTLCSDCAFPNPLPKSKLQWCCIKPQIKSENGLIEFSDRSINLGPAPLPMGQGYEDPDFCPQQEKVHGPLQEALRFKKDARISMRWLEGNRRPDKRCPRNLCSDCYESKGWRVSCQTCDQELCIAHDLRNSNPQVCGYLDPEIAKGNEAVMGIMNFDEAVETGEILPLEHIFAQQVTEDCRNKIGGAEKELLERVRILRECYDQIPNIGYIKCPNIITADLRQELDKLFPSTQDTFDTLQIASPSETPHSVFLWRGCGIFMCRKTRQFGDHRPSCTGISKECTLCGILVCGDCLKIDPACTCQHCRDHYRCPRCFPLLDRLCTKNDEKGLLLSKREKFLAGWD